MPEAVIHSGGGSIDDDVEQDPSREQSTSSTSQQQLLINHHINMSASPSDPPVERKMKAYDLINRGVKRPTPLGTTLFVGLRALDPLLQYGILAHGIGSTLLSKLGITQLPLGLPTNTGTFVDKLGLSPYRLIILAMAAGSSIKQIYWVLATSEEEFPPGAALSVVAYNTVFNSINSLAFTTTIASASLSSNETFPQTPLLVGCALYVVGIFTEAIAETQRRNFKRDPRNKGKVYSGGLWGIARHINYTGYSLWRAGYTLACSGWGAGAFVASFLLGDFNFRAIKVLDEYCAPKYGAQWTEYKRKTPYKLIPGLF